MKGITEKEAMNRISTLMEELPDSYYEYGMALMIAMLIGRAYQQNLDSQGGSDE